MRSIQHFIWLVKLFGAATDVDRPSEPKAREETNGVFSTARVDAIQTGESAHSMTSVVTI